MEQESSDNESLNEEITKDNRLDNNLDLENINLKELKMVEFEYAVFEKKIPEYSGDKKMLKGFVNRCDGYFNTLSENGKIEFFQELLYKLNGDISETYKKSNDWTHFRTEIMRTSQPTESVQVLLARMKNLRQVNRSVKDFAESIS